MEGCNLSFMALPLIFASLQNLINKIIMPSKKYATTDVNVLKTCAHGYPSAKHSKVNSSKEKDNCIFLSLQRHDSSINT